MQAITPLLPSRLPRILRSDIRRDRLAPALATAATVAGLVSFVVRLAHYDDPAGIEPSVVLEGASGAYPLYLAFAAVGGFLIPLLMVATRIDRRLLALLPLMPVPFIFAGVQFLVEQSATPGVVLDPGLALPVACAVLFFASSVAAFFRR